MSVDLQIAIEPAPSIPVLSLDDAITALRKEVGDARLSGDICLRVCDSDESRQLNLQYRGKDEPTNVLSFPADQALPDSVNLLGDLAVCWPVVVDEAKRQDKPVADHLTHLFVHGTLHLLGFDHEETDAAAEMEMLEVRTLSHLGIADPYGACD